MTGSLKIECYFVHLHDSVQRKKVERYSCYIHYIQEQNLHVTLRTVHGQRDFTK